MTVRPSYSIFTHLGRISETEVTASKVVAQSLRDNSMKNNLKIIKENYHVSKRPHPFYRNRPSFLMGLMFLLL